MTLTGNAAAQIKDAITLRGRVGWAYGDFLPYVFGGVAVGRMDVQRTVSTVTNRRDDISTTNALGVTTITIGTVFNVPSQTTTMSQERTNDFVAGWTGGLGMEYALWNNVFLRGEWEYIKFLSVKNIDRDDEQPARRNRLQVLILQCLALTGNDAAGPMPLLPGGRCN